MNARELKLMEDSTRFSLEVVIGIQNKDRRKLNWTSWYVIIQCLIVFVGAFTILQCKWDPETGFFEMDILARIMYLYDTNVCGQPRLGKHFQDLVLDNNTFGLDIVPIKNAPAVLIVLTKLSGKTRKYIKYSIAIHTFWIISAIAMRLFMGFPNTKVVKTALMVFRIITIITVIFDVAMGAVYIADIQQSLTKGMIIRYSGWGMVPRQVSDPEEFGGWVPIIAAAMWLRGGLLFSVNICIIRFVRKVMQKIRGKEVKSRINMLCNVPFPDAAYNQEIRRDSLHYRAGEYNKF